MALNLDDFRKPEKYTKQVQSKVKPSDYLRLESLAKETGTTVSSVIRVMVERGLDEVENG